MPAAPSGTIASVNAGLTLVVFDAASAADWVPTRPAANKAQFTGHPAEVMRGLAKGDEVATVDVGASGGYAFELEGSSGRIEVYRLGPGMLALVAPPRAWWTDPANHGDQAGAVEALFAEATMPGASSASDAVELGELELPSGTLAAVYLWLKNVAAAREHAAALPRGGAHAFGDGYAAGQGGLVVDLGPGTYRLVRRELAAPWAEEQTLVVMYLVRQPH